MKKEPSAHIWVKTPKVLSKVEVNSILYCTSESGKATIFKQGNCPVITSVSLADIEKLLPQDCFCRCHRNFLVNLYHVEHYAEKIPEAILVNDIRVPVVKDKKEYFRQRLTSF